MAPEQESWFKAAEALVGKVQALLGGNRTALLEALAKEHGRDRAEATIQELEHYVTALELHLWRAATEPDRISVGKIAWATKRALLVLAASTVGYVPIGVHHEVLAARDAAEVVVVECGERRRQPLLDALQDAQQLRDRPDAADPTASAEGEYDDTYHDEH